MKVKFEAINQFGSGFKLTIDGVKQPGLIDSDFITDHMDDVRNDDDIDPDMLVTAGCVLVESHRDAGCGCCLIPTYKGVVFDEEKFLTLIQPCKQN